MIFPTIVFFVVVMLATAIATKLLERELRRRNVLDVPNYRSSHNTAVPRGGGIAVTQILVFSWAAIGIYVGVDWSFFGILFLVLFLAAVCWIDDLFDVSVVLRLICQIVAVAIGLFFMPKDAFFFQGYFPPAVDYLLAAIIWLWFINLFNFMDGIDGISGCQMASLGFGVALIAALGGGWPLFGLAGIALAAAGFGFLLLNWHPARIFLGDVGSIPIGYLIGWLLLSLSSSGLWIPALILPAYYFADASITLLRRLFAGKPVWIAHREHFYQKAVSNGRSHSQVVSAIAVTNIGLIAIAAGSIYIGSYAFILAFLLVGILLGWMSLTR